MKHSEIKLASITDAKSCIDAIDSIKFDLSNYKKSSQNELLKAAQSKLDKLNLLLLKFDSLESPVVTPQEIIADDHKPNDKKSFIETLESFSVLKADLALNPAKTHQNILKDLANRLLDMELPSLDADEILIKYKKDQDKASHKKRAQKGIFDLSTFDNAVIECNSEVKIKRIDIDVKGLCDERISVLQDKIAEKFSDEFITVRGPVSKLAPVLGYVDVISGNTNTNTNEPRKVNRKGGRKADPKNQVKLEEAVKIILTGKTREQAAAEVGLGVATLYRYLKKNPIPTQKKEAAPKEQKKEKVKEQEQMTFEMSLHTKSSFINTLFDALVFDDGRALDILTDEQLDLSIEKFTQVMSEFSVSDTDVGLVNLCVPHILKFGAGALLNTRSIRRVFEKATEEKEKEKDLEISLLSHEVIRNHVLLSIDISDEGAIDLIKQELKNLGFPERVAPNSEDSQKLGQAGVALSRMQYINKSTVKKALSLLNLTDSFDAVDVVFSAFPKATLTALYKEDDGRYFDLSCSTLRDVLDKYDLPHFVKKKSKEYKKLVALGKLLAVDFMGSGGISKLAGSRRNIRKTINQLGTIQPKD